MLIEDSTHYDQEITGIAKRIAKLVEPQLTLRLRKRDGDAWLDALNDRRSRRLRGKDVIPVGGLYDARAVLDALVRDEVARGLVTADGRRAADNLRVLATLAAHQRPEARRPQAAEQARVLGARVLQGAGIPESALGSQPSTADGAREPAGQQDVYADAVRSPAAAEPASEPSRPNPDAFALVPAPPMSAQLAWRLDARMEEVVLLEPGQRAYLLGRDFDCDVLLDLDLGVSRRHAYVSHEDAGWWIADAGSKNGTGLNGVRVVGKEGLADGMTITVGRTDVRFELLG